jgi:hypothetical protein
MAILFACSACGKTYRVPDEFAGRKTKCRQCGAELPIPGAQAISAVPAPLPAPMMTAPPPLPLPVPTIARRAPAIPDRMKPAFIGGGILAAGLLLFVAEIVVAGRLVSIVKGERGRTESASRPDTTGSTTTTGGTPVSNLWNGGPASAFKYLPANTNLVISIRLEEFLNNPAFKDALSANAGMRDMGDELGLEPRDTVEMLVGGALGGAGGAFGASEEPVGIVHTKRPVTAADLMARMRNKDYKSSKVGRYLLYERSSADVFCVIDSQTVLYGKSAIVRAILERDRRPEFLPRMETALRDVDLSKTLAFAFNLTNLQQAQQMAFPGFDFDKLFASVETLSGQISIGKDMRVNLTARCKDSQAAEDLRKLFDGVLVTVKNMQDAPREAKDLAAATRLSTSGTKLTANLQCELAPVLRLIAQQQKMNGGMFGP